MMTHTRATLFLSLVTVAVVAMGAAATTHRAQHHHSGHINHYALVDQHTGVGHGG